MSSVKNISLFKDVKDLSIEGGSFNLQNAPVTNHRPRTTYYGPVFNHHTSVRNSLAKEDVEALGSVLYSAIKRNELSIKSRSAMPQKVLLSKVRNLIGVFLPFAHPELAQRLAHRLRRNTPIRDNAVLVGVPLLSASISGALSEEVQVFAFYLLVAMILVDLLRPLRFKRPSAQVTVMDALGKYHDFPWAACENPTTFHRELLNRFWNQTGFSFVKRRSYEVEHNGCVLKSEDWAIVKPFTCLFVDFIHIQQDERNGVKCPWCQWTNPIPLASDLEMPIDTCSCSQCGRDCSVTTFASFQTAIGDSAFIGSAVKVESEPTVSVEIVRIRIKIQVGENRALQPLSRSLHNDHNSSSTSLSSTTTTLHTSLNINTLPVQKDSSPGPHIPSTHGLESRRAVALDGGREPGLRIGNAIKIVTEGTTPQSKSKDVADITSNGGKFDNWWRKVKRQAGMGSTIEIGTKNIASRDVVIAVIGPTGVGKSTFIENISGVSGNLGHSLVSCTQNISVMKLSFPEQPYFDICLIDTPGFDDTNRSDLETFGMISKWMNKTYKRQIPLSGVLYLHRITDNRIGKTHLKNLGYFERLCGGDTKIVLATTMWDNMDAETGCRREQELREVYWKSMIDRGSSVRRSLRNRDSAFEILGPILDAFRTTQR